MFNKEKPVKVNINEETCIKCGKCVDICPAYFLELHQGEFPSQVSVDKSFMGCIQCGHCMMSCPTAAIEILGEDIDKEHLASLDKEKVSYDNFIELALQRRSVRKYTDKDISTSDLGKIIKAASTSATSVPPTETKVLIIKGREKVQELADDVIEELEKMKKALNPVVLNMIKVFKGKNSHKLFTDFILPLCDDIAEKRVNGEDVLFFNAPVVILFYHTDCAENVDAVIASNTAMLAAESLGLGTCYIGTLGAIFENSNRLKQKYKIQKSDKVGIGFTLGYPRVEFNKGFYRKFKEVNVIE